MRTLSIIIPTYNEAASIDEAIRWALLHDPIEVIVCDGNSEDGTQRIVEAQCQLDRRIVLIAAANGRGRQLAAGAREATGDVLLFLHADNRLEGKTLDQMAAEQWPIWGGFQQRIEDPRYRFRLLERGNAKRVIWLSRVLGDQAMFVDRETYQQVGGYDEVDLMEDVMLSRKLSRLASATLLPGRVRVDPRRWQKNGVVRQTFRNWMIQFAFACGVSPKRLRRWYG